MPSQPFLTPIVTFKAFANSLNEIDAHSGIVNLLGARIDTEVS